MRIECPQCQSLFDARSASRRDDAVFFFCSKCNASISLPLSPSAPSPSTESAPSPSTESAPSAVAKMVDGSGDACPKCSAPMPPESKACGACGLAAALFAEFEADDPDQNERFESAWQQLGKDWESAEAHESFIEQVALFGDYRAAAVHYRGAAATPALAQRSKEMLERIQSMATAALLSTRPRVSNGKRSPKKIALILLAAILLLTVGILVLATGS